MCVRAHARARALVFESVRACFYVLGTTARPPAPVAANHQAQRACA